MKIVQLFNEPNLGLLDIAREIRQDQVVSAKLLKLCNSALFGMKRNIDTVERALVILGEKKVLALMLSASLEVFFPTPVGGYSLCKGGLYAHSFGVAVVSERLARMTNGCSPDLAYTAGLLHDIGKVVLDQYIASYYPFFYRRTQLEGADFTDVERQALGLTHQEAGKMLAEEWLFPGNLTEVIATHHLPERAIIAPELTNLVFLADILCSRFLAGQEIERLDTEKLEPGLKAIGLTLKHLPLLIDRPLPAFPPSLGFLDRFVNPESVRKKTVSLSPPSFLEKRTDMELVQASRPWCKNIPRQSGLANQIYSLIQVKILSINPIIRW